MVDFGIVTIPTHYSCGTSPWWTNKRLYTSRGQKLRFCAPVHPTAMNRRATVTMPSQWGAEAGFIRRDW